MNKNTENMIVAHGGGPTAVINSSLHGVVEEARKCQIKGIYGAINGIEGVLNNNFYDLNRLTSQELKLLSRTPASAIGSCRRKIGNDDVKIILNNLIENNVRYFFYNGGNDSMDTCSKIAAQAEMINYDLRVVGIPKTIDNDLYNTDHCPGYGSAARYIAVSTGELLCDVRSLPIHISILEVMGRNAGWLAAAASLANNSGNMLIYLPEIVFNKEKFLEDVKCARRRTDGLVIVVSEGIKDSKGKLIGDTGIKDGFGHTVPGGAADVLARMISSNFDFKVRTEKPGLLGRASISLQSKIDAREAYDVGVQAVRYAINGGTGKMISIVRECNKPYSYSLKTVPLDSVAEREKKFPLEWINENGTSVSNEFTEYCTPLIGDDLPKYLVL